VGMQRVCGQGQGVGTALLFRGVMGWSGVRCRMGAAPNVWAWTEAAEGLAQQGVSGLRLQGFRAAGEV
jgi:hypothetical protein